MTPQRVFVSTAFLALVSALIGLGALAAGASNLFGSLNAGERIAFQAAAVLGFLTGGALLFQSMRRAEVLGPTASAVGALVAALAFSMPAVQAFAADTKHPRGRHLWLWVHFDALQADVATGCDDPACADRHLP